MMALNLPQFDYKVKNEGGKTYVFDIIRKKYVILTPEEWVRQNFLNYLIQYYQYPKSLIRIESGHRYNSLQKRSDIVIYDRKGQSFLLVECKATTEKISQKTLDQIAAYNHTINAKYLVLTNGLKHFCLQIDRTKDELVFMKDIPSFEDESDV
jgi:hypothetical protein